jgi:hypothetical protein
MEENSDPKSVSAIGSSEDRFQDHYEVLTQPELILIEIINQEPQPFPSKIKGFSIELDNSPQAPSDIPQLILSLCTVSIATCNKLLENMTHFYGDKSKSRILGTINTKTSTGL